MSFERPPLKTPKSLRKRKSKKTLSAAVRAVKRARYEEWRPRNGFKSFIPEEHVPAPNEEDQEED